MFASLALLALPLAAYAQSVTHTVVVGGTAGLVYTPNQITAAPGDTVLFEFHAKNHTATQTSFPAPCTPNYSGVNSGFQPVDPSLTSGFSTFSVTVNDTNPLWFSCQQTGHCQMGMVFAVNAPTSGNTFDAFLQAAKATATAPPATTPAAVTVTETVTLGSSSTYTTTYASYPSSADPTPNAEPVVHTVTVGGPSGLVYTPNRIDAKPHDIVRFKFMSKNHTATQSSFEKPCSKAEFQTGIIGFDSGFMPATDAAPVTWNLTVNDTAPVWVYCRQTNHCGSGMVFAINSVESGPNTFAAFQAKSKAQNAAAATGSGSGSGAAPSATNSASSLTISASAGLGAFAVVLAYFL